MKRVDQTSSLAERLALLSEPTRLRILRLLEAEELAVGELARVVQLPQSTVSRHLKLLAEPPSGAGEAWVTRRNVGTAAYYRLLLDDLPPANLSLWLTIRAQLPGGPEHEEDQRRLRAVVAERRTDSAAFFGRVAGEWDQVRSELFGQRFTPLAFLSFLPRDWTVADLGCGTGNAAEFLAPVVRKVYAVDRSEPMLDAARRRLEGRSNVEFVAGDLAKLPIASASVDAAVCLLVLHHLDEPMPAVREMRRILRAQSPSGTPSGSLLLVDMVAHDREDYRRTMGHRHLGFGREALTKMLHEVGFVDVTYHELAPEPDAKGPGLFVCTARLPESTPGH
ncbi:MAG: metalloregulator ArsR/SmtB family transcription factor [Planctomycetota bacterium]|nr:metalloregulator ArsR/SmtB family transcription factor [Planctomycetota bacterium]